MTRSSRHKSSKHSSTDARDYSDSEKDSSVKDRKGKDDSSSVRVSKEAGLGSENRKLDSKKSKEVFGSGNGEYAEEMAGNGEYSSSSKRRKDRAADDGVNDRWNGGEDERIESSRKSKGSSESKCKRRDDSVEQRSKSEGKHREWSRKESREEEREMERERKGKEGKNERFAESEEHNRGASAKQSVVNEKAGFDALYQLPSPELENQIERRIRRKRDCSGDGDKHEEEDIEDINDRRRDDVANEGRQKDKKHKDERYRDKYREDVDRDSRCQDERPARDHTSSRSDDKHPRDEKEAAETRQKKSKLLASDRDREHEYDNDRDFDLDCDLVRHRDRDHDRGQDRDRRRDCDGDRDHDRGQDRDRRRDCDGDREWNRERNHGLERGRDQDRCDCDRDQEWDQDRDKDRYRNRDQDRNCDLDHYHDRELNDGSHLDDRSVKYKDSRGRKRSSDEHDDCADTKSRGIKAHYSELENKSLSRSRVESDVDKGRSQSRQAYVDSTVSSNRCRTSPSTSSHGGSDEYRHSKQEDLKSRDSGTEQRSKAISSKEVTGFLVSTERGSKYISVERATKIDDGHFAELSVERPSSSKASLMGLAERSPSSTSLDRRYANRTGARRSLDIEETGRRSSIGPRELSANEDRLSRDLPLEKPPVEDSSHMDLLYCNRTSQSNSSSLPPPSGFRAGVGSPSFMGSLEEDGRVNISARYRRSGDPNVGREQGNAWRGTPNWSSPVPNGFMHFQHGPPHGGYPAMMSQFPSPSLFTVRPPMEMNQSGIPYHMHDADRFAGHLHPLGWQNMMDGSASAHMRGWDGNNGAFRNELHMYGGAEWDQNRHPMNGRGWETCADVWKGENGDVNMDLPSASQEEDHRVQAPLDDVLTGQTGQQTEYENSQGVQEKDIETRPMSTAKESFEVSPKTAHDGTPYTSKISNEYNYACRCHAYLSKLDISLELAGSELYGQCMNLLDMDQTETVDEETTIVVNLKDGGRAVPKSFKMLLSPPLFPVANDFVFQRAMDHYKKQRVQMSGLPIVNGGTLDITSTFNLESVNQGSLYIVEKTEELVLATDTEMKNTPAPSSDHERLEDVSHADVQETLEELASIPQALQDGTPTSQPSLGVCEIDSILKSSEEAIPVLNGNKMDEMVSEVVISEGVADGYHPLSLDNVSQDAAVMPTDGGNVDEISKTNAEEKQSCADETRDTLYFSDGSHNLSGALMPGSNESELVILSRIHHSPGSTH